MARIELNNVFKAYGDHAPVIRDVSLDIGENEFCVFVGPSGCGKSTLLRMIAGLETINDGELRIGGQRMNDVAPAQRGEAMTLADRIVLLNAGEAVARDGSVAQCGAPLELYHRPCNKFVAGFIGSPKMNFVEGTLHAATAGTASIQLPQGEMVQARVDARRLEINSAVTIGLRPEDAEIGTATQHVLRTVQWQERLGESTYLYLDSGIAGDPWVVKAPGNAFARAGERVAMSMPAPHLHLFDSNGRALERTVSNEELPLASQRIAA